jgi:hypothetical protein
LPPSQGNRPAKVGSAPSVDGVRRGQKFHELIKVAGHFFNRAPRVDAINSQHRPWLPFVEVERIKLAPPFPPNTNQPGYRFLKISTRSRFAAV